MATKDILPTILITGASKGIGKAIAIHLAQHIACKLALLSRNESLLNETANLCKAQNGNIETLCISCDISNKYQFQECIDKIENEFGP